MTLADIRRRLELALWLVDGKNPLTPRVAVNHFWARYFGTGILETRENFGVQSPPPSHPRLLDWLASTFVQTGWDIKRMQRLIVTSATYRQSSRVNEEKLAADRDNRLLARGARFRMPAEMVRDQALAAAGLLSSRLGGPSVKPYQPGDLWKDIATDSNYDQDHGENLYRRSLYTYWKRTGPAPVMMTLDAAKRDVCRMRRERTSSPLQAFVLMNGPQFVEASRVLSQRLLQDGLPPDQLLTNMFRTVTSRRPSPAELQVLRELHQQQQAVFVFGLADIFLYLVHRANRRAIDLDDHISLPDTSLMCRAARFDTDHNHSLVSLQAHLPADFRGQIVQPKAPPTLCRLG